MKHPWSFSVGFALVLGVEIGLSGCTSHPPGTPNSPPTATVGHPLQREVTDYADFPGRTAAVDAVQVRARVNGYLEKINFKDGAEVKEGAVLFEIDPRPYAAIVEQAEAQVRLQEAQLKYQESLYNRDVKLTGAAAVSKEELQKDQAARDTTQAQVNAAKANLAQAQLNLGFTKVLAPISGRLSRTLITRGNLVVADQTILTSIVSLDPIYAYFDVDEDTVLRVRQLIREGKFKSAREQGVKVPVLLGLANESGFPHEGYVDFVNNEVSSSTGTLQARGAFANPQPPVGDRVLTPGLFVRIRVPIGPPYKALLVPQSALGADQNLKFIYVLGDQNQVVRRNVKLGTQHEGLQAIPEGLKPDDRVIIYGVQHVRPGMVVNPKLVEMPVPGEEKQ
jgi:RND family efflux transporter MFP subunit